MAFLRAVVLICAFNCLVDACSAQCAVRQVSGTDDWCVFTYGAQTPNSSYFTWDGQTGRLTLHRAGLWDIRYQSGSVCFSGNAVDIRGVVVQSDGISGPVMSVRIQGRNVIGPILLDGATTSGGYTFRLELENGGSVNAPITATSYPLTASVISGNLNNRLVIGAVGPMSFGLPPLRILGNITKTSDSVYGVIDVQNDVLGPLQILGNVAGRILVKGYMPQSGSLEISGDVQNNSRSGIAIRRMSGGLIECHDMDARGDIGPGDPPGTAWPWGLYLGVSNGVADDPNYVQVGTVRVNGTLRGSIVNLTASRLHFDVGTLDGFPQYDEPHIEHGGIYSKSGFYDAGDGQPESLVEIGDFVGGLIQTGGHETHMGGQTRHAGRISISGNMGGVPGKSARIVSQYVWIAEPGDPSISFDSKVNIGGSLYGTASGQPAIKANGNLNGHIFVNGSLRNYDSSAGGDEIAIRGSVATGSAVAIDYAGYDADNEWQSGAVIRVGSTSYTTNTPGQRLYRISRCRGDMNNDDVIDSSDDTPFGLTFAAYSATWPGLDGSWSYHRDANQDGVTGTGAPNPADAAAFLHLRNSQCCIPVCNSSASECPGDVNADGAVNLADLALVLASFGSPPPATIPCVGLDQDGLVDLSDLADVNANFGTV